MWVLGERGEEGEEEEGGGEEEEGGEISLVIEERAASGRIS